MRELVRIEPQPEAQPQEPPLLRRELPHQAFEIAARAVLHLAARHGACEPLELLQVHCYRFTPALLADVAAAKVTNGADQPDARLPDVDPPGEQGQQRGLNQVLAVWPRDAIGLGRPPELWSYLFQDRCYVGRPLLLAPIEWRARCHRRTQPAGLHDQRPACLDPHLAGFERASVVVEQQDRALAERQRLLPSALLAAQPGKCPAVECPAIAKVRRQMAGSPAQLPRGGGGIRRVEEALRPGAAHFDQKLSMEERCGISRRQAAGDVPCQVNQTQGQQRFLGPGRLEQLPGDLDRGVARLRRRRAPAVRTRQELPHLLRRLAALAVDRLEVESRGEAPALWERFRACTEPGQLDLAREAAEFHTAGFAELLCEESRNAAGDSARASGVSRPPCGRAVKPCGLPRRGSGLVGAFPRLHGGWSARARAGGRRAPPRRSL